MTELEMFLDSLKASVESYTYLTDEEKKIIDGDMGYYKSLCMFERVVETHVKEKQIDELEKRSEKQ